MLDSYSDAQLLTFHRTWLISTGELESELRHRGWSDWRIETAIKFNIALRVDEVGDLPWLH